MINEALQQRIGSVLIGGIGVAIQNEVSSVNRVL